MALVVLFESRQRVSMDKVRLCASDTLIVGKLKLRLHPGVLFWCAEYSGDILLLDRRRYLLLERFKGILYAYLVAEVYVRPLDQHLDFLYFLLNLSLNALLFLFTDVAVHYALRGLILSGYLNRGLLSLLRLMNRMVVAKPRRKLILNCKRTGLKMILDRSNAVVKDRGVILDIGLVKLR